MKKTFLLITLLLAMFTYASSNILTNGSFETPSNQKSKSTWRFYLADGWVGYAHPKHGNDIKVLTNGAIDGKRFNLHDNRKTHFC